MGFQMKTHEKTSKDVIIKKMHGDKLSKKEITMVVEDIIAGKLDEIEITSWLVALYINRMDDDETLAYTKALVHTGSTLKFGIKDIYDFHSIGGLSGNKITPIIVSVVAAAGLTIPKTSTHAISSACGTVDFVDTFCKTEFTADETVKMIKQTKGLFIQGGFENHCPADDLIIKVEYTLKLNPYSQFFPSILGKKMGMSVKHLLIEIPTGPTAKMKTLDEAKTTAHDFIRHGKKLGMNIRAAISDANQPIGYTVGPILEARECIASLQHPEDAPADIIEKVCVFSGTIIQMSGKKNGYELAKEILFSGKAYEKFKEIVKVQKGNPKVVPEDLKLGKHKTVYVADQDGYVSFMDNSEIIQIARAAGAPTIAVAGIRFFKKIGDEVSKGEPLFEIYSSTKKKADSALALAVKIRPYEFSEHPIKKRESVIYEIIKSRAP